MSFKVGDKIRAYEISRVRVGIIDCIDSVGDIRLVENHKHYWYHPKQCRKLKQKRVAREWWMCTDEAAPGPTDWAAFQSQPKVYKFKTVYHVREVLQNPTSNEVNK